MQKHVKNAMSQMEFKDFEGVIETINLCASIATKYANQPASY